MATSRFQADIFRAVDFAHTTRPMSAKHLVVIQSPPDQRGWLICCDLSRAQFDCRFIQKAVLNSDEPGGAHRPPGAGRISRAGLIQKVERRS